MSPFNKRKLRSSKRTDTDVTKRRNPTMHNTDIAAFIRENTIKDSLLLKTPVVMLQRIPNILPRRSQKMFNTIVDKPWKTLDSSRTRISLNNQNDDERNCIRSLPNLSLKFSTPRTMRRRWKGNSTPNRVSVSRPSEKSFDTNDSNLLDVREQTALAIDSEQDEARKKDGTYELAEPKTPNLQRELRKGQNKKHKRTNSNVKEMKKTLNVHLKRLSSDIKRTRIPVLQSLSHKKKLAKESNDQTVAIIENKIIKGTTLSASGRKSTGKDYTNVKSFTLLAGLRGKSKINTTSNPTVKKLDLKNVTPRKVPNFAEIHEKLFAKSESVVDARKRLKERHAALRTLKINDLPVANSTPKNNSLPRNSNENQFRHKMRIKDATNCILKKKPTVNPIRSKCQQQSREFLKGVRTNRRFELQMKIRNMNRQ